MCMLFIKVKVNDHFSMQLHMKFKQLVEIKQLHLVLFSTPLIREGGHNIMTRGSLFAYNILTPPPQTSGVVNLT